MPDPTTYLYGLSAGLTVSAIVATATGVGAPVGVALEGLGLATGAAATVLDCTSHPGSVECAVGIAGTVTGAAGVGGTVLGAARVLSPVLAGFGIDYDALAAGFSVLSTLLGGK